MKLFCYCKTKSIFHKYCREYFTEEKERKRKKIYNIWENSIWNEWPHKFTNRISVLWSEEIFAQRPNKIFNSVFEYRKLQRCSIWIYVHISIHKINNQHWIEIDMEWKTKIDLKRYYFQWNWYHERIRDQYIMVMLRKTGNEIQWNWLIYLFNFQKWFCPKIKM